MSLLDAVRYNPAIVVDVVGPILSLASNVAMVALGIWLLRFIRSASKAAREEDR